MLTRHYVDTSVNYGLDNEFPEKREIENPESDLNSFETTTLYPEPYIPDPKLVDVVNLSIALGRPLLIQGEPGCGKTRLAYALAYSLGLPLENCYIKSTTSAQDLLYSYDAVRRLYDAQLKNKDTDLSEEKYVRLGPLGRSIKRATLGRRSIVLIDEIDKADFDFPNDLLLELDRLQFSIIETGRTYKVPLDKPELRPIIIITHNGEKSLPTAFLRRCIFHYLEFPNDEKILMNILKNHDVCSQAMGEKAIEILKELRKKDLDKKPGLSELIDWVAYLHKRKVQISEIENIPHKSALIKSPIDIIRLENEKRGT